MPVCLTYFVTTTLSTVGLGDMRPVSNFERLFGSLMMLGGNIVFSIIFGQASNSLQKMMLILDPLSESEN